jgi:signal transduction histidine kinase
MTGDPSTVQEILRRTRDEADAAVREVHRVLDALRPGALDRHDLAAAIRETAERLGFGHGNRPAFTCTSDQMMRLSPGVEETAYRIAGEALHNVARHAQASSCEVTLVQRPGSLELCIADDGVGVPDPSPRGVGLHSMHKRATESGGTFTVSAPPSHKGTLVQVRLPVGGHP